MGSSVLCDFAVERVPLTSVKKKALESKTESENMNLLTKLDFPWQTHTNDTLLLPHDHQTPHAQMKYNK